MNRILRAVALAAAGTGLAAVACAAPATGDPVAQGGKDDNVAARVGDHTISVTEVDARAKNDNSEIYQQLYTARRAALDAMVADYLLGQEAKARGVSVEELTRQEIDGKITPATEAQVQEFFNQNQARMGGQTLETVGPRIQQHLDSQSTQAAANAFLGSLKAKAALKIALEPPRVDVQVAQNDPTKGPATAPITLVEFSEFQCPFCQRVGPAIQQVLATYGDKVRLVFRDYPLPFHDNAQSASEAAQCAHEQGQFWAYHDKLFQNQQALAADKLKQYATEIGLDAAAFTACFDSGRFRAAVQEDAAHGQAVGVSGTPAFFINGRFLSGAQPFEAFKTIIDEELEMKGITN